MKLDVYVELNPDDPRKVNISFIEPQCKLSDIFSKAVDDRFGVSNIAKRFIGGFSSIESCMELRFDIVSAMILQTGSGDYVKTLKEFFNEVFKLHDNHEFKHTIADTKFIGNLLGKDYYLRENVFGYVIDIRHSDEPYHYTTWRLEDIGREYYHKSAIIDIIPPTVYNRALALTEVKV